MYNARFLDRSGLGAYAEEPTREQLAAFLGDLPHYRARLSGQALDPREQEETLLAVLDELRRRPKATVI
jgi:hypothetical protein